jgi:hypothetical protein
VDWNGCSRDFVSILKQTFASRVDQTTISAAVDHERNVTLPSRIGNASHTHNGKRHVQDARTNEVKYDERDDDTNRAEKIG